jgi:hypothetical protein
VIISVNRLNGQLSICIGKTDAQDDFEVLSRDALKAGEPWSFAQVFRPVSCHTFLSI